MLSHGGPTSASACAEMRRADERTVALHPLDEAPESDMRGDRAPHMDMLRREMPVEDSAPRLLTCCADTSVAPFRHLATQPFVTILGDPDNREMERKRRPGARARVTHVPECTENLLRLPPKGGVLPLPIGDNKLVTTI